MARSELKTTAEVKTGVTYMATNAKLNVEGIFTNCPKAESPDETYFNQQVAKWQTLKAVLNEQPRYVHVSNCATSLWHAACNDNMVRFGVAGYGLNLSGTAITAPYALKPALSLTSQLVHSKQVVAGESVGYGATYTAQQTEWVGTVPMGYADGYERRLTGLMGLADGRAL